MDPNWIIALTGAATFLSGTLFTLYKIVAKIRLDRKQADERRRLASHAQAEEALRIAREETQREREDALRERTQYQELLLKRIAELEKDLDNEQQAREILQQRYEEILRGRSR